jgi:hypothetical protein
MAADLRFTKPLHDKNESPARAGLFVGVLFILVTLR